MLLGPLLQQGGTRASNSFPCLFSGCLLALRMVVVGASRLLIWGEGRGVFRGWVGEVGWLRWFAHPLGGAVCRRHAQYPTFVPILQKRQLVFLVSFYLIQNLPPTAQRDMCLGVCLAALQQMVPGLPRGPPLSHRQV